ncbi:MAG: hypothetical protein ACPKQO_07845 [Nitrososphaeraceae archaeon]
MSNLPQNSNNYDDGTDNNTNPLNNYSASNNPNPINTNLTNNAQNQ